MAARKYSRKHPLMRLVAECVQRKWSGVLFYEKITAKEFVGIAVAESIFFGMTESAMTPTAELKLDDKVVNLPVLVGTEGEHAVDISKLRDQTGTSRSMMVTETRDRVRARSPSSTETMESCGIGAFPLSNSPRGQISSRQPTSSFTGSCRLMTSSGSSRTC